MELHYLLVVIVSGVKVCHPLSQNETRA